VSPTRDFTFVNDTAHGFINALTADTCGGAVINLGSDFDIPIGDLGLLLAQLMGYEVSLCASECPSPPDKAE